MKPIFLNKCWFQNRMHGVISEHFNLFSLAWNFLKDLGKKINTDRAYSVKLSILRSKHSIDMTSKTANLSASNSQGPPVIDSSERERDRLTLLEMSLSDMSQTNTITCRSLWMPRKQLHSPLKNSLSSEWTLGEGCRVLYLNSNLNFHTPLMYLYTGCVYIYFTVHWIHNKIMIPTLC